MIYLSVDFIQCRYNWLDQNFYFITTTGVLAYISQNIFQTETHEFNNSEMDDFIASKVVNLSCKWGLEQFDAKKFEFTDDFKHLLVYVNERFQEPTSEEIDEALEEISDLPQRKREKEKVLGYIQRRGKYFHLVYVIDLEFLWGGKLKLEIEGYVDMERICLNFDGSLVLAIAQSTPTDARSQKINIESESRRTLLLFELNRPRQGALYYRTEQDVKKAVILEKVRGEISCVQTLDYESFVSPVNRNESERDQDLLQKNDILREIILITGETSGDLKIYKIDKAHGGEFEPVNPVKNIYQDRLDSEPNQYLKNLMSKDMFPVKMMLNHNQDILLVLSSESEVLCYHFDSSNLELRYLTHTSSFHNARDWSLAPDGQLLLLGGMMTESLQCWHLPKFLTHLLRENESEIEKISNNLNGQGPTITYKKNVYKFDSIEDRYIRFYMWRNPEEVRKIQISWCDPEQRRTRFEIYRFGSIKNLTDAQSKHSKIQQRIYTLDKRNKLAVRNLEEDKERIEDSTDLDMLDSEISEMRGDFGKFESGESEIRERRRSQDFMKSESRKSRYQDCSDDDLDQGNYNN